MSSTSEISDAHENTAQQIAWLVNGTLSGEEAVRLRAHLAGCARCRDEFESEKRLYEAIRAEGPLVLPGESSFEKLLARIESDDFAAPEARSLESRAAPDRAAPDRAAPERAAPVARGRSGARGAVRRRHGRRSFWRSAAAVRWLAAAAVLEAAVLGLGAWVWHGPNASDASAHASPYAAAPYRTLTTPPPRYGAGTDVRVVFRPDLSLERLQQMLTGIGAHIVDGPTEAHVYTLGFGKPLASAALDERIAALRASPDVLFAEPASERPP